MNTTIENRVNVGKTRENQIAEALKRAGLNLQPATEKDDKYRKIDRWLIKDKERIAVQIKYRTAGDDLLFEVFHTWINWDNPNNRPGRDMIGQSELYAVLRKDAKSVVLVPVNRLKALIKDMLQYAESHGWTENGTNRKTLRYIRGSFCAELKVQADPADGRTKMVAYVPSGIFVAEQQAEVYRVNLPKLTEQRCES